MTRALLAVVGVLALLSGLVGWRLGDERARADQLEQQLAAQKVLEAQLQARADTLERRFRVDTGHLRVAVAHWNTAKARLDTAWLHDTVPVPVEVVHAIVAAADTTIHACTIALGTCTQRVAAAEALTRVVRRELGVVTAERDQARHRTAWYRPTLSAGYGATLAGRELVLGPSVLVGFSFRF